MKPQKVENGEKGVKVVFADEKQEKQNQRQAKLAALAEKKAKGKLALEDLNTKLDIIIELLTEKPPK
jgi:translation initiation factor IF-3